MSTSAPPGWDGLLDPGEEILWQGRPDGAFSMPVGKAFTAIFGVFFAGFALFWMVMAGALSGDDGFWMFGLLHFGVGVGLVWHSIYFDTFRRRRTWYTLTDRRGFIATDMPWRGRNLKSYLIDGSTVIDFEDGSPGSIWFASERYRTKNGHGTRRIGFQRLDNAREVYRHIRNIQRAARQEQFAE